MKEDIKNLVNISRAIGIFPQFVQGGGGNSSVKIDGNLMAIKASGYLLKDMSENDGFSFVNYHDIKGHISANKISNDTEDEFSDFIKGKTSQLNGYPKLKPSIETGFHALLPQKYIVHTHSVYANIVCCSKEGQGIVNELFPGAVWVPYANPGKDITIAISDAVAGTNTNVIFMENHGLVVGAESSDEAFSLHEEVNNKIINHFRIDPTYEVEALDLNVDQINNEVIFPDQVVYLLSEELRNTQAGRETLYAYDYIMKQITKLGLTPNFISKQDVGYIENMESEKYRKSLAKK
ncbi:MAG: class II aldolase/adducin family protein [Rickettsiaceae bacterium]|nr:class II aldolase/adducin family protein [Rickettsiaceae bacterium]